MEDTPEADPPKPFVTRLRGLSNVALLIGALTFGIGWIVKAHAVFMAVVGLAIIAFFLVSSIAILVENRRFGRTGGRT